MKRVVLFIFAILLCLYSTQLLASSEDIVARFGFGGVYDVKFSPDGREFC